MSSARPMGIYIGVGFFNTAFEIIFNAKKLEYKHCVKSVPIRSYSGPYFSAFGLPKEKYGLFLRIQSECWKIRTRTTPNTDPFHAVKCKVINLAFPNMFPNKI